MYDSLEATIASAYQIPIYAAEGDEIRNWLRHEFRCTTTRTPANWWRHFVELVHRHIKYRAVNAKACKRRPRRLVCKAARAATWRR